MSYKMRLPIFLLIMIVAEFSASAQIQLPGFFSDSMVLQRDKPIQIYGRAKSGEKLKINFGAQSASVTANKEGNWKIQLKPMPAGGPYKLEITGKDKLTLHDIWMGDVWFCSGQSNMEWKLGWLEKEKASMEAFRNNDIRMLTVPHSMSEKKEREVTVDPWKPMNPQNAPEFSAVASYFAKFLQPEIGVPVGIILSAWGGTDIEPWMSADALGKLPKHSASLEKLNAIDDMAAFMKAAGISQSKWEDSLINFEPGNKEQWYQPDFSDSNWQTLNLPGVWDTLGITGEGNGWLRRHFSLSPSDASIGALLSLGRISQRAQVYINGTGISGPINLKGKEIFLLPATVLKPGDNVIALKVTKLYGQGGIYGPAQEIFIANTTGNISLAGAWKFRPGLMSRNPAMSAGPNQFPSSLYNGMVHPFNAFPIKGVLWYQGENNTGRPADYAWHLQQLIKDWRETWKNDTLPFLVVQLPNYLHERPASQNFVQIRKAQQEATQLPNVGLAVTIDIGNASNIHPVNKKDVGYRLSLLARKIAYGEKILAEGPAVKQIKINGNRVDIEFNNPGKGLMVPDKYGYVKGFEVAGSDNVYYPAKADIHGNSLTVSCSSVPMPEFIRYAWAEDPDANLFNSEGLPASPFSINIKKRIPASAGN